MRRAPEALPAGRRARSAVTRRREFSRFTKKRHLPHRPPVRIAQLHCNYGFMMRIVCMTRGENGLICGLIFRLVSASRSRLLPGSSSPCRQSSFASRPRRSHRRSSPSPRPRRKAESAWANPAPRVESPPHPHPKPMRIWPNRRQMTHRLTTRSETRRAIPSPSRPYRTTPPLPPPASAASCRRRERRRRRTRRSRSGPPVREATAASPRWSRRRRR